LFAISANAHDYKSLIEKFNQAPQPTEAQLKSSTWKYIGIQNNPDLPINEGYENHWDLNGYKNPDNSLMTYSFEDLGHPQFHLFLVKRNYITATTSLYITTTFESGSVSHAFSAYPSQNGISDLYFVENCRIDFGTERNLLICPSILKLKDGAPNNYPSKLMEALDKVMSIQVFSN
jgi:hypothetical protein